MKTPHKHAELIKAWADWATIQVRDTMLGWVDTSPIFVWCVHHDYRIKPEPKPDIIRYARHELGVMQGGAGSSANVRYTYDGDTGKLKKVEMIDE